MSKKKATTLTRAICDKDLPENKQCTNVPGPHATGALFRLRTSSSIIHSTMKYLLSFGIKDVNVRGLDVNPKLPSSTRSYISPISKTCTRPPSYARKKHVDTRSHSAIKTILNAMLTLDTALRNHMCVHMTPAKHPKRRS